MKTRRELDSTRREFVAMIDHLPRALVYRNIPDPFQHTRLSV